MKSHNLEHIFKNTIIINYYQKERSRDLFTIKREMDEKTDIHNILRLIDEYKDKVEDEYYLDMEEKQGEENERNKLWFLNYGDYDDEDEDEDYDEDDEDDDDDYDDEDDDDDDDDVYKFGVDFNNFKESQNISIW